MWWTCKILVLLAALQVINAQSKENECMFQDTCDRCLGTHINCAWCADKSYELRYRCLTRAQLTEAGCSSDDIYGNEPDIQKLQDNPVRDYETSDEQSVQVQPQRVYMKLVKSHPQRMKLTYRPARNNPLDLYVLMDLTWTMRDDKETLSQLGAQLGDALSDLTENYRLGFGSFADKPVMPMVMPQLKENPCAAEREVCDPTYGFRHHFQLSENVHAFVQSVNDSRITGNLDNLEGGLDALMQVLVCPSEIGWKATARKIVLLVTDGFMHFAGDGLLAGITRRNDRKCHLSAEGEYLGSLVYDYPSLEEIYRELLRRKVNVIFAVTEGVVSTYRELSVLMKEISNVEILSADSSNILELIKKSYESFIKRTQFTDNSPPFIKLEYETNCAGQFSILRPRSYCNDIKMGEAVEFYVNVTLLEYPKEPVYHHTIRIEESSLNEYIELELELQQPCPCNEVIDAEDEYRRFACSNNGYLQCGMCQCDAGWAGTFCSCPTDTNNATTNEAIERMCRQAFDEAQNTELGPVCSNRGECECGSCYCFPGYAGKYCECMDCHIECDPERADCICGRCVCKDGWSGNSCNCKVSTEGCIGPTGEICSGRGECKCGTCECLDEYMGNFCEIGSGTENKLCAFYEPCVMCLIGQRQGLGICENLTQICSSIALNEYFTYTFTSVEIDAEVRCLARLENKHGIKCDHYFTYKSLGQEENYLIIQVNECEPTSFAKVAGYISLLTCVLGLLIIMIVMCFIHAKDKREFALFEKAQRNSVLMESPIYKNPITHYIVPKAMQESNGTTNPFA